MRTFNRVDWEASLRAWMDGKFSDEWKPFRHQAAMRGMIYPPEGTRWDSWEDDEPSDRAIIIRAIREAPGLLRSVIDKSRGWPEVVAQLVRKRDEWREDFELRERQRLFDRFDEPDQHEATVAIKRILERIGNS